MDKAILAAWEPTMQDVALERASKLIQEARLKLAVAQIRAAKLAKNRR